MNLHLMTLNTASNRASDLPEPNKTTFIDAINYKTNLICMGCKCYLRCLWICSMLDPDYISFWSLIDLITERI